VTEVRLPPGDETRAMEMPTSAPSTNGAHRQPPTRVRTPRRPRTIGLADVATMIGSLVSAVCFTWLVFGVLTEGIGWLGFFVVAFVMFAVLLWVVTADQIGATAATDRVVTAIVFSSVLIVMIPLVWLIYFIFSKGLPALTWHFFTQDQRGVTPVLPATAGGASHAIVGTLQQVGLALVWSLPLGLMTAIFLNESRSRWRRPVRIVIDAMSGLPSIVAGLFIYAVFVLPYAKKIPLFGFNGFMASLALSLIMLPTITRTVEVVLRLVPDGLREASLAMGSSRARTTWSVVLPTARTGMTTAVVLGIARAVGETAPLLFTAFGYDLMNSNPFNGAQEALPLFIYRNIRKPDVSAVQRGFAGALVLMFLVLGLFLIARYIGRDRSRSRRRRQRRAAVRQYLGEAEAA
jgi:phosphate transport system permease protein